MDDASGSGRLADRSPAQQGTMPNVSDYPRMTGGEGSGLTLSEAVLAVQNQITRLDESQRRNPDEVLKFPASELLVEQIKDVMHFIPERDPLFGILRKYITNAEGTSGNMKIVHVLPMIEALHFALSNEYNKRLGRSDDRHGGFAREDPQRGIEMHHQSLPRIPRRLGYRPEILTGEENELAWLRPPRKPD